MMLPAYVRGWMSTVRDHVHPLGEKMFCVSSHPLFRHKSVHMN